MITDLVSHILFPRWLIHIITFTLACRNKDVTQTNTLRHTHISRVKFIVGNCYIKLSVFSFYVRYGPNDLIIAVFIWFRETTFSHYCTLFFVAHAPVGVMCWWQRDVCQCVIRDVDRLGLGFPSNSSCQLNPAMAQATLPPQRIVPGQDSSRTGFSLPPDIIHFDPAATWSVCRCHWLQGIISNPGTWD